MDPTIRQRLDQVRGRRVWQLRVDNEFWLVFLGQLDDPPPANDLTLVIGGAFSLTTPDGHRHEFDQEYAPADLGPAMQLLHGVAANVRLADDGELALEFDNGCALSIPPDPHFEAWRLIGPGWRALVSPPGGGAPVWPAWQSDIDV